MRQKRITQIHEMHGHTALKGTPWNGENAKEKGPGRERSQPREPSDTQAGPPGARQPESDQGSRAGQQHSQGNARGEDETNNVRPSQASKSVSLYGRTEFFHSVRWVIITVVGGRNYGLHPSMCTASIYQWATVRSAPRTPPDHDGTDDVG